MNRRLFRVIRRLNGHSQLDAARHFGITQSGISKWETGETGIHRRHLSAMRSYALSAAKTLLVPLGIGLDVPEAYERQSFEVTDFE